MVVRLFLPAGLVEANQTRFYAEPIHVLASRMGLPQLLVDLRHDATHNQVRILQYLQSPRTYHSRTLTSCLYHCRSPPVAFISDATVGCSTSIGLVVSELLVPSIH